MAEKFLSKLEYWDTRTSSWFVGHKGIELLHPENYAKRLAKDGKVARVTLLDTGEVIQILDTPEPEADVSCILCGEAHSEEDCII